MSWNARVYWTEGFFSASIIFGDFHLDRGSPFSPESGAAIGLHFAGDWTEP